VARHRITNGFRNPDLIGLDGAHGHNDTESVRHRTGKIASERRP
jgi:hypothetical protein